MSKYANVIPLCIVAIVIGLAVLRSTADKAVEHSDQRIMMDTFVEIRIWGEGNVSAEAGLDSAFAVIGRIDRMLGDGLVTSAEAGLLDGACLDSIMAISARAWQITGGLFDPTIGSVSRLWEFGPEAVPPRADSIEVALARVGLGRYLAGDVRGCVLDIGGVAKGYALELAARKLAGLGFGAALLNAGGDIKIMGERPGGGPWRIAIRHPRDSNSLLGCLEVGPVSIATSGDYERAFVHEGRRYHHILDPRDGMPSYSSISATVIGANAGLCDALATGLFVMGGGPALELAEKLPGIEAVFVFDDSSGVMMTEGIARSFEESE